MPFVDKEKRKEYYDNYRARPENIEKTRERSRKYYEANRERQKAKYRDLYAANKDQWRIRYLRRKDEISERNKRKYLENREHILARKKKWQEENNEEINKRGRERQKTKRIKRDRLASRPKPDACEACGRKGLIVWDHDHKTGLFRGWPCTLCNLALGCLDDNVSYIDGLRTYLYRYGPINNPLFG